MRTAAVILSVFLFSVWGLATTYHVPGQVPTIQQAIDLAHHGDTVLVAPGTFFEHINFKGKDIAVQSSHGPEFTVIDGNYYPHLPVVLFENDEGPAAILDGFKITHGSSETGGAILCSESVSPTIRNNYLLENESVFFPYFGGGIFVGSFSSPSIENNTFESNEALLYGGAIYCDADSDPIISDNLFDNNTSREGGSIYCNEGSSPKIRNNIFFRGDALFMGGGICCYESSPLIENNAFNLCVARYGGALFCDRTAGIIRNNCFYRNGNNGPGSCWRGGAIFCSKSTSYIINNTMVQNSSIGSGGGLHLENSYPVVANNIFWRNEVIGNIILREQIYDDTGSLEISHCIIEGGWPGKNNLDMNPLLLIRFDAYPYNSIPLWPYLDLHIMQYSPCIDAGDSEVKYLSKKDFEGNYRLCDGDGDGKAVVDIGCDEFSPLRVPKDYDYIQEAIDCASDGEVVLVSPGTYYENLNIGAKKVIVSSSHGPFETVIDGKDEDSTVTFHTRHETEPCLIGFTIMNGLGVGYPPDFKGGGITCFDSSPFIDRCIIRGNQAKFAGGGICLRDSSSPLIQNCILYDNVAQYYGGGVAYYDSEGTIRCCTLYGNIGGKQGGGIHCDSSDPDINGMIIWKNESPHHPSLSFEMCNPYVGFSDIDYFSAGNNINVDPMFRDPENHDFHLEPLSPCINTGRGVLNPLCLVEPGFDIDGEPRYVDRLEPDAFADMGADEFFKE